MQPPGFNTAIALLLIGLGQVDAHADGGQVRVMQTHDDVKLTIFTSPSPLRAGPIDVGVLLQDARTGQTIPDADISIELTPPNSSQPPLRVRATADAATNKLLRAALLELPSPGRWKFRVECVVPPADSLIAATFTATAAEPLPRWLTVWPWFTWPIAAVALFAIHRTLVARRTSGGTPGASSDGRGLLEIAAPRPSQSLRDVPPKSSRTKPA